MSPDSAHRDGQLRSRWLSPPLLSLAVNLPLALFGLTDGSYDAYAHIFFADHYRRWWFNLFEPRWFGGLARRGDRIRSRRIGRSPRAFAMNGRG